MNITAKTIKEQVEFLASEYAVKDGIIQDPGKFEGNQVSSLYFHDCVMSGGGDEFHSESEDGPDYDVFFLTNSEREVFDLEHEDYAAVYYEDNNGFVYCPIITETEYDELMLDLYLGQ